MLAVSALEGRVIVVSPHLDDAVFSLGSAIARAVRTGARVEVLTVLAGDPTSKAPVGRWDARAGHETEGEAARARREEDRRACAVLGATPYWLPYGDDQYERHAGDLLIREQIVLRLQDSDVVLLPGDPLKHPDHLWLARLLLSQSVPCGALGLYREWPYARTASGPGLSEAFRPFAVSARDRLAKWRAVRKYATQLPHLGSLIGGTRATATRLVVADWRAEGEAVSWLPDGYRWVPDEDRHDSSRAG